jgi:hypothetical protein
VSPMSKNRQFGFMLCMITTAGFCIYWIFQGLLGKMVLGVAALVAQSVFFMAHAKESRGLVAHFYASTGDWQVSANIV